MIALDASLALAWTFADERSEAAIAVLQLVVADGACVPGHWHLEIANGMTTAVRTSRASIAERDGFLADLARLSIDVDAETADRAWTSTIELADLRGLTAYDAAYLEMAIRRRLPLATLDRQLLAAARNVGVETLP